MTLLFDSTIAFVILLMLVLILLLILLACKPWRFFFSSLSRSHKSGELERPLVSDDVESNDLARNYDLEGACYQNEGPLYLSSRPPGLVHKQRVPSASPHLNQGDSLILDIVPEPAEDISVGQTLKRTTITEQHLAEVQRRAGQTDQGPVSISDLENDNVQESVPCVIADQRSCLSLEVISGPSRGLQFSIHSTSASGLPLTLGRVSSDLLLKDSEVSGKHAMINWNMNNGKWELTDMGSLNGTLLNAQSINHHDSGSRHWSDPVNLSNGDIITLGTTSNIRVYVTGNIENRIPFRVGVASDPMALRRGGKKLAMEDVCYYHWPLPGTDEFGVFGICDGHGGVAAANSASKMLPQKVAHVLTNTLTREQVISQCDATEVLKVAFSQTEASMNNYYEGCTATVLLVWTDGHKNLFAQCANVGDSACVIIIGGKQLKMTEDHRVTSDSERLRINELGPPLKDGETRLCGLNLARMLGDKFLKQQDARFSSEPFISKAVHIDQASSSFALLASDGFWDVVSVKKAVQLVLQTKERYSTDGDSSAEKVANFLLSEAKAMRTKDNTSVIFLDFEKKSKASSCKVVP